MWHSRRNLYICNILSCLIVLTEQGAADRLTLTKRVAKSKRHHNKQQKRWQTLLTAFSNMA